MNRELLAKYDRPVPRYTSYPTAPHFHAGIGPDDYRNWLAELPPDARLSLYLHVPFCQELCWYCGCHTTVARRYQPVAEYQGLLLRELDLVGEALGGRRPVGHVHFGGGTPTMLAPDDLRALGERLHERFEIGPDAELAVEIDPRHLSRETVDALAAIGVNRASLGVQDVNPEVQRPINRWQPFAVVERAVKWLRAAGIPGINFDLMYGLPQQTTARVQASVDAALTLRPARIALFGYAHVPWMKRHQRLLDEASLPDAGERAAQFEVAGALLQAAGYVTIGLDHFALPDDSLAVALEQGRLHRNFQGYTTDDAAALVGFGASAIGGLPQGYVQNAVPLPQYRAAIRDGRLATTRGIAVSDEDRLRRAIIERLMCEFAVDLNGSASRLAAELEALEPFQADGLLTIEDRLIRIEDDGRPLVRTICAVFDAISIAVSRATRAPCDREVRKERLMTLASAVRPGGQAGEGALSRFAASHPFADVLRTIGRGATLGRPLDETEAERAMGMILDGAVEPVQLGAFLLVLRYRTETPAELAGFVRAARARIARPGGVAVDLDWPSYADRHKQLPYFLLAALLLAHSGVRVLMHGIEGGGPATTPAALRALGIRACATAIEAAGQLGRLGFAYLPLRAICPELEALFHLRPLLGLRSPANSIARELNPFHARHQIQGVFHPTYLPLHQETAQRLCQAHAVIFKGGGGEAQRNPDKPCRAATVEDGVAGEALWPALTSEPHPWRKEPLEPLRLADLWRGEWEPPGPVAAVVGTAAMALKLLARAASIEEAEDQARRLWRERPRRQLGPA